MNKKIGKFKLWQLIAIGGALGLIVYEYEKGSKKSEAEPAEGLVASTNNPLAGEGGGGSGGGSFQEPPAPGAPGEPGPAGAPGAPAPEAFTPKQVEGLEELLASKNSGLPSASLKPAPLATKFPQVNSKGEHFRTIKKNGKTVHEYHSGRKVTVGAKKKPVKHANPNHKVSHAAPRAPVTHARPKKPTVKTKPRRGH